MRTTINIDSDIFMTARSIAHERDISIGKALSDLARKGLRAGRGSPYPLPDTGDLPAFAVREDSPPLTPEQIKAAEDEE